MIIIIGVKFFKLVKVVISMMVMCDASDIAEFGGRRSARLFNAPLDIENDNIMTK